MTWDDYYEKINDWAVSTAVNKISSLEDMGSPDEITDALNIIAFEDEKGATRLLNKALQFGVKFSGENLSEIVGLCSEESFKNALYQSADVFTSQDLEDLYCCVDDELIVDVAKKYHIQAPSDIESDYEEELCTDASTPISWQRFYDGYCEWTNSYAIARSRAISHFGDEDEVLEVANDLFATDQYEASAFIQRALDSGVRFNTDNLLEITSLCDTETTKQAVFLSSISITEDDLEELCGNVDDDVIIEVAQRQNLKIPEDMRDKQEDETFDVANFRFKIQSALEAADYALECLVYAQRAMNDSGSASFLDMFTSGFFTSFLKQATLSEADAQVRQAQIALNALNIELRELSRNKSVQLKYARLATAIDLWFDDGFLDAFTHLQINKAQKRISKAIRQVEVIKQELQRL